MSLILALLNALFDPPTKHSQRPPQRKSRWHRPGHLRYHWHLTPNRQRHYFVQRSGRWLCPFCGCA